RLLLADARGTVWNGSAVPVLSGGPDSLSAAALPGRTGWTLGLRGLALELRVRQPCCMHDDMVLVLWPALGRLQVQLLPGAGALGEWPAAWLAGLGAPWNTLQLSGTMRLASPGLALDAADGRWRISGQADLDLSNIGSRLSTLERLGSYRLHLDGGAAGGQGPDITLSTLDGALLLSGSGQWTGAQLRFRGEARAAPGFESALDNLLNLLGRRQGALSLISIG
ncbi:MAG: type II secretion system protein N, partial [Rubrivivax sp.]